MVRGRKRVAGTSEEQDVENMFITLIVAMVSQAYVCQDEPKSTLVPFVVGQSYLDKSVLKNTPVVHGTNQFFTHFIPVALFCSLVGANDSC